FLCLLFFLLVHNQLFCVFLLHSSIRKVAIKTGKVEILQRMADGHFGEGLTLLDDRLIQLEFNLFLFMQTQNTLSKGCSKSFHKNIGKFTHGMKDGWGLATDGKEAIVKSWE
ncbi:hypothetical protein MKW94_004068, partial [Papaver nudicaule]|nr:hypothetical protein [Papaver nudicaule]